MVPAQWTHSAVASTGGVEDLMLLLCVKGGEVLVVAVCELG